MKRAALDRRPSEALASASSLTHPGRYHFDRPRKRGGGLEMPKNPSASVASAPRGGVACFDAAMRPRQTVGEGPGALRLFHRCKAISEEMLWTTLKRP